MRKKFDYILSLLDTIRQRNGPGLIDGRMDTVTPDDSKDRAYA